VTRAVCALPAGPNYRRDSFLAGIRAAGVSLHERIDNPDPNDFLLVWNRSAATNSECLRFCAAGGRIMVAENGYFGKIWMGRKWFALAWDHHAGAGRWLDGGPQRWDSWGVEMMPWINQPGQPLIFEQRGIGEHGIASPAQWAERVRARIGGNIRKHPGAHPPMTTLEHDLKTASCAVTWHSSAALRALLLGMPVWYAFERWIGAGAARHLSEYGQEPRRDDDARLATMRRLAWAMWDDDEVKSGEPFKALLCAS